MNELLFGNGPIAWVQDLFGTGRPFPFRVFSLLGDTWGMLFVAGLTLWLFGRRAFYPVLGIIAAGAASKVLLSTIFQQQRPSGPGIVVHEHLQVSSFPSGHVYEAMGPWLLLWALGCIRLPVALGVPVLVGLGRIYLGTHYLGDVIAGLVFGAALVWIYVRLLPRVRPWVAARGRAFWTTLAVAAVAGLAGWTMMTNVGPRRYEVLGMVAAAAAGIPLERRWVDYVPADAFVRRAAAVLTGTAGIAALLLADRLAADDSTWLGAWTAGLATAWTVLAAPALLARTGLGASGPDADTDAGRKAWRWAKRVGIGIGAVVALALGWGAGVEPRLIDTQRFDAPLPNLPGGWEGATVAVVADWQVGMWGANTGTMRRVTRRLVEARPAAVLLAGDFIYRAGDDAWDEIRTAVDIVAPLARAGIPTFAVLGNHDYGLYHRDDPAERGEAARLEAALEAAGIPVLRNESVPLVSPRGDTLFVVGIGSEWAGEAHPDAALRNVPPEAARVVLMHNPTSFRRVPAGAAPLAVAGHTHGGQVRIPGTPYWSWLNLVEKGEAHADGWIADDYGRPGNRLYVNRGIGFSTVPVRVNCPPEITYLTLRGARAVAGADPATASRPR